MINKIILKIIQVRSPAIIGKTFKANHSPEGIPPNWIENIQKDNTRIIENSNIFFELKKYVLFIAY
jgi:hypothetical protein